MTKNETTTTDPIRQLIMERAREMGISDAQLSRAIGHGDSYINQYHRRGSPAVLPDRERRAVAKALKLDEALLIPDAGAGASRASVARAAIQARSGRYLPVFHEGKTLDFDRVTEWVDRPDFVAMAEHSFGLWVHSDHGKLGPGDMAFVTAGRPPRAGDVAVALTMDQRHIVAIGLITEMGADKAILLPAPGAKSQALSRHSHVLMKVAAARFV